eukprot:TRINITY_DN2691_c0_g1_i1.p1 TRINITY_DN2691_c0_g1~~TRINITY_DN2691_c0_g1_i1.p1  ORF type:complete len:198 (-),score=40.07 TRINITY_DN2691_c0_g1_i1:46-639(-)
MGAAESTLRPEDIAEMQAVSNFSAREIRRLYKRFVGLDKQEKGSISTEEFLAVPELSMNPLKSRIIQVFDSKKDGQVNFQQFVRSLNVFHPLTPKSEKLKFMFQVYDLNGDGMISRDELQKVLRMMVGNILTDEHVDAAVEGTMLEADPEGKGHITFQDFERTLGKTDISTKMSLRFASSAAPAPPADLDTTDSAGP